MDLGGMKKQTDLGQGGSETYYFPCICKYILHLCICKYILHTYVNIYYIHAYVNIYYIYAYVNVQSQECIIFLKII